jgi:2-polyprenyl-6-hydroxyphenyl methylase/3-demethylubiquinone-9 3-methyltransferase
MPANEDEVLKFSKIAQEWWRQNGSLKTLHAINVPRVEFILKHISCLNLQSINAIDIGCGGGILTESLYNAGLENITGVDASKECIEVAKIHAKNNNLNITYRNETIENIVQNGETYNLVCAMEIIEHVDDAIDFLHKCFAICTAGGFIFLSTINNNIKSKILVKFAAEYLLNIVPKGTHETAKFVKPITIINEAERNNLLYLAGNGIAYNPIANIAKLTDNLTMNYILCVQKP